MASVQAVNFRAPFVQLNLREVTGVATTARFDIPNGGFFENECSTDRISEYAKSLNTSFDLRDRIFTPSFSNTRTAFTSRVSFFPAFGFANISTSYRFGALCPKADAAMN